MVIGFIIGQQLIFTVVIGVIGAVGIHRTRMLRVIKTGYTIFMELAAGIKHAGIEPIAGAIVRITHNADSVIHLIGFTMGSDQLHKVLGRFLDLIQIATGLNRTGLVHNHHNIHGGIMLDQGGNGVILGISFQGNGIRTIVFQNSRLICCQVAFYLLGIAVRSVGQIVDHHHIFRGIVRNIHMRIVGLVIILTANHSTGIDIAVDLCSLNRCHDLLSPGSTADHLRAGEHLVGVQLQVTDGIIRTGGSLPLGSERHALCQSVTHINGTIFQRVRIIAVAFPALEHITLSIGVSIELLGVAPGVHKGIGFLAGGLHQEFFQTVNHGIGIATQIQIQDHRIFLGNQGHLQRDTLLGFLPQIVIGRAILHREGTILIIQRTLLHICAFYIVAVELKGLGLVLIHTTCGVPIPDIIIACAFTAGGIDSDLHTIGIGSMLADHLIGMGVIQITVKDLSRSAGGTEVRMDQRGVHQDLLLILIRSKHHLHIHLGIFYLRLCGDQILFSAEIAIQIAVVQVVIVQTQNLNPVYHIIVGHIVKFVLTHALQLTVYILIDQLHNTGGNIVKYLADLLLQNHHGLINTVIFPNSDLLAIPFIGGICGNCAGKSEVCIVASIVRHISCQQLTAHILNRITLCIRPADKQLIRLIGNSNIIQQRGIPILISQSNALLAVHQALFCIKSHGVRVDIHNHAYCAHLLFAIKIGAGKLCLGIASFRVFRNDSVCNLYRGFIQSGTIARVDHLITGSTYHTAVRHHKGGNLHSIQISFADASPIAPNGVKSATVAIFINDNSCGRIGVSLLCDDMPTQHIVFVVAPVADLHIDSQGHQCFF